MMSRANQNLARQNADKRDGKMLDSINHLMLETQILLNNKTIKPLLGRTERIRAAR